MKTLLLKIEPVIWLLFGQGILVGTLLLTGWILVVGITSPLGITPPLSYERALALATNPIGAFILLGIMALPLWKGAHHVRSLLVDFGGAERDPAVATLLYLIAAAGSGAAVMAIVRLF